MRFSLLVLLVSALFAIAACGDDDDDESASTTETPADTTAASSPDQADVEAAIAAYFAGGTPAEVCAVMTRGLQAGLAGPGARVGDPAAPAGKDCEEAVQKAVDDGGFSLEPVEPEVQEVAVSGMLAAARIVNEETVGPEPYGVFLVKTDGEWLIHGEQQAPPGYEELEAQVAE